MELISMCVVPVKLRHGDSGETLKTYALLDSCSHGEVTNKSSVFD